MLLMVLQLIFVVLMCVNLAARIMDIIIFCNVSYRYQIETLFGSFRTHLPNLFDGVRIETTISLIFFILKLILIDE